MFKRAAVFTDIHFGLKNNSQVHNQDCEDFVDWYIETAKDNNCETGIFCGDWHHNRNSLNISTLNATIRSMEKLGSEFENFYFFDGNHDLYYKDKRDINSTVFAKYIPGITFVDQITVIEDVAIVPWLVGDEWKKLRNLKCKYMFGHFELPKFFMNARVRMPDNGELKSEHLTRPKYVFSGHFHARQNQDNIHYIGNAFPHNYSDAWDDDRGMMVIDRENDLEPMYHNWSSCPKYRTIELSKLLNDPESVIQEKMHLRVTIDLPISFEESQFIKETFMTQYNCREFMLIPQTNVDDITSNVNISKFESVDEIVSTEITHLDSEKFDRNLLLSIYNDL